MSSWDVLSFSDRDRLAEHARKLLSAAGVPSVESDVEQLLFHFFERPRIGADERFFQAVLERSARVPLAHILGWVEFCNEEFLVGSGVFAPRAQSVPLIEDVCSRARGRRGLVVVDLCAGVGPIGLTIAGQAATRQVWFVENDHAAISYLERNIRRLGGADTEHQVLRFDIFEKDGLDIPLESVDILVANPPFVPFGQATMPEFSIHHPFDAIFSGQDGSQAVRRCCEIAGGLLRRGGILGIEHHETHVGLVKSLLENRFTDFAHINDGDGKSRITTAVKAN